MTCLLASQQVSESSDGRNCASTAPGFTDNQIRGLIPSKGWDTMHDFASNPQPGPPPLAVECPHISEEDKVEGNLRVTRTGQGERAVWRLATPRALL